MMPHLLYELATVSGAPSTELDYSCYLEYFPTFCTLNDFSSDTEQCQVDIVILSLVPLCLASVSYHLICFRIDPLCTRYIRDVL
jgi:hypothetical protein